MKPGDIALLLYVRKKSRFNPSGPQFGLYPQKHPPLLWTF